MANSQGVTIVREGQTVSDGLILSVVASYANSTYHPIALLLLSIGVMMVLAEHHGKSGPLEVALFSITTLIMMRKNTKI